MPRASEKEDVPSYNGPGREAALEATAEYEEFRFKQMQAMSGCGAVLRGWEKRGGSKKDIQDLYEMRDLSPEEVMAEFRRISRSISWKLGVDENKSGQRDFFRAFEQPAPTSGIGIGAAPLGSRLSLVRAKVAGYNDGRAKGSLTMQDGLAVYQENYGWEPTDAEALAYAEGYGEGLKLRPPPKARKSDAGSDDDGADESSDEGGEAGKAQEDDKVVSLRRSRKGRQSAVGKLAERAQAMDDGGRSPVARGPATLNEEIAEELAASPPADTRPGWRGDRDFSGPADIVTAEDE